MPNPYSERSVAYFGEAEIWRAKHAEACRAYAAGEMRHAVFLAVLFGLGFRRSELLSEEALHRTEKSIV